MTVNIRIRQTMIFYLLFSVKNFGNSGRTTVVLALKELWFRFKLFKIIVVCRILILTVILVRTAFNDSVSAIFTVWYRWRTFGHFWFDSNKWSIALKLFLWSFQNPKLHSILANLIRCCCLYRTLSVFDDEILKISKFSKFNL